MQIRPTHLTTRSSCDQCRRMLTGVEPAMQRWWPTASPRCTRRNVPLDPVLPLGCPLGIALPGRRQAGSAYRMMRAIIATLLAGDRRDPGGENIGRRHHPPYGLAHVETNMKEVSGAFVDEPIRGASAIDGTRGNTRCRPARCPVPPHLWRRHARGTSRPRLLENVGDFVAAHARAA
jgi:hypothetical protein